MRGVLEYRADAVHARDRAGQVAPTAKHLEHGGVEHHHVPKKHEELARGHHALHDVPGAEAEQAHGAGADEQVGRDLVREVVALRADLALARGFDRARELVPLVGLRGESLDDFHPEEPLDERAVGAREHVLGVRMGTLDRARERAVRHEMEREHDRANQRELPVHVEQDQEKDLEHDHVHDERGQAFLDEPLELLRVVHDARAELADLGRAVEADAHPLEVVEDVLAEVERDVLRDADGDHAARVKERVADDIDRGEPGEDEPQELPLAAPAVGFREDAIDEDLEREGQGHIREREEAEQGDNDPEPSAKRLEKGVHRQVSVRNPSGRFIGHPWVASWGSGGLGEGTSGAFRA